MKAETTDGVVYRDKNVRFTVVADGLIRMEYAPKGKFVDDKSFVAVNREYPKTNAKVSDDGRIVTVSTPKMTLTYEKSKGPFTSSNLKITSAPGMKQFEWHPGMQQKENLRGTTTTLDRWDGADLQKRDSIDKDKWHSVPQELEPGLLARDGWTLIDDSRNFLFDGDPEWDWVKERKAPKGSQDWYFLSYGDDYKGALQGFTLLSGKPALPPRYAFGYWWSRWWAYSEHEFRQLVNDFRAYDIPLEVLVVDMDWHYTDADHGGWTGWTWNRRLFPEPQRFLNYLRDENLNITLNLHPASGVKKFESCYPELARDNGINPASEKDVPWVSSDKRFMKSIFKHILTPMEKEGVSFWWLDWQQDEFDSKIDSLSNIWWINHAFFTEMEKNRDVRPMIYHRWGGLGNHRYQIGFSGDNYATWKSLAYLPYFTKTASNVLYGFWCHDLGGHYMAPGGTAIDPELYVRSLQFGAYSPVMRTHSNKNAKLTKEPWNFDRHTLNALRQSIQRRYEMAPYVYTMARKAHDTGLSIVRPMYYDYPTAEEAYQGDNQYMFGDNMIVVPVTEPSTDGYATVKVWLPEGQWYENATGTMLDGGRTLQRRFAINEVPVFIKAGSVIPFHADKVNTLRHNDHAIALHVFPGGDGTFTLYEDNGNDKEYKTQYATTDITSTRTPESVKVNIAPRKGSYADMPDSRRFRVTVPASERPEKVTVDGVESGFSYDPAQLAVIVDLPEKACSEARTVEITLPQNALDLADGTIGAMKRFVETFGELKNHYARLEVTEDFGPMSIIYEALAYSPEKNRQLLEQFRSNFSRLGQIAKDQPMSDEARDWFLKHVDVKPAE